MEPVRIKLYGLVRMTRRGYLIQLSVSAALLLVLLVVWLSWQPASRTAAGPERTFWVRLAVGLLENLHWVLLTVATLCALEAWYVLRRFARRGRTVGS